MIAPAKDAAALGEAARLRGLSLGELKTLYRERLGRAPQIADKRLLIAALLKQAAQTWNAEAPVTQPDEPIAPKEKRSRGRARANAASGKPETIEGPASTALPKLSPGTKLTRQYKGKRITVTVMEGGLFEHDGQFFRSLSAIAKKVTGSHCSGVAWFGLRARKPRVKR